LVEDLKVTNKTISNWIDIFERVYICYRIYPYNKSSLKSLKKEPKLYLWDYTYIEDI
jgi:predicted AAA+ superfamily ATPase